MVDEPERPSSQQSAGHGQQLLTIVRHERGLIDLSWVRFLLGAAAGEVVDDPERTVVQPYSLVVTAHPHALSSEVRARVRRTATVGLLHVGDRRYRSRLDAYWDFAFVWRTHLHSSLIGLGIRQIPLGPTVRRPVAAEPLPEAGRPASGRRHLWSYAGDPEGTAAVMLQALQDVPRGWVGGGSGRDGGADVTAVLADSVFAPCPMQDGHLESTWLYDALELGAIPIIERRRWLDYFGLLFGAHPLLTVERWRDAPELIRRLSADPAALAERQTQVVAWWTSTKHAVAVDVWQDVLACQAGRAVTPADMTLERPPPRWRGWVESLRHTAGSH